MAAYITTCFADWQSSMFRRGVMAIEHGRRSDRLIRRPLRPSEREGVHWYRKVDPDFDRMTYSRCHQKLRQTLQLNDIVFFRTLWRGVPYIIGYFRVAGIRWPREDAVILAGKEDSRLIHFELPVSPSLVRLLNPHATNPRKRSTYNQWVNANLGRNYMRLNNPASAYLRALVDDIAASL